ncbi:unnamed protein product [Adineta ricciae]|uniref:Alpha/beta-hydrolase n=1 Tax=Adineta ricciae TaxID=249248 RepID=A0A814XHV8_ADIRI|nr:unnamed protein product [Adineta ricciae]CAF1215990.1 unnamed protein product [Adineta ricciae]
MMHNMDLKFISLAFISLFYVYGSPIELHSNSINTLSTVLNDIIQGNVANIQTADQILNALLLAIGNTLSPPSTREQIIDAAANASNAKTNSSPPNLIEYAVNLLILGIDPNNVHTNIASLTTFNSMTNNNPHLLNVIKAEDPQFSADENILRAAMYFPTTFNILNSSDIPAIIMIPATAIPGGQSWASNYAKKFAEEKIANPMWLNIPSFTLQDAQISAEYVAYAINYVSQYTGNGNVSVIAWSQGTVNTQWALKYFRSTRKIVSDFIAISPDFRGTVLAEVLCPKFPRLPCAPSILQQIDSSTFIKVLRQNGGDSEIVPTTTVYSATDEVVQPQSGPQASGLLLNASNNLIQDICPLQPAGLIYTHEGMLYNPLGYALAVDALTHEGHADVNRMLRQNPAICLLLTTPGLTVEDVLIAETTIITFALNIITYSPKQFNEPSIKKYALSNAN